MQKLLMACGGFVGLAFLPSGLRAETPPAVVALQEHLRTMIDAAEPGVAAILVSTNPAYVLPLNRKPGELGTYNSIGPRTDGIVQPQRDKLDLSDTRSAADNTFGSGLVLDRDGFVLTNYHLIEGARKIFVRFNDGKGSYADVHAADARSDLAVLRLTDPLPARKPVKFGRVQLHDEPGSPATVYRGQFALALAHPFAAGFSDGKPSVSSGLISNIRRRMPNTGSEESRQSLLHHYSNLLQTDARLNLGSSGGGLFNLDGEVIGLLSATAAVNGSEASGGYALPLDNIYRRIIDVLREGREVEYGFLGVAPGGMSQNGLIVGSVSLNTPASAAGLEPRDVIVSVDGRPVRETEDLFLLVGGSLAGTEITLDVRRDGRKASIKPRLAKFAHPFPSIASQRPDAVFGLRVDHTSLLAQQPMMAGERRAIPAGVVIRELEAGSPAAARLAPLQGGKSMIITTVNDREITTPAEFAEAVRGAKRITLKLVAAADANETHTVTLP